LTVIQLAEKLGVLPDSVRKRIARRKIQPVGHVGYIPIYSPDVIDQIRQDLPRGRKKRNKT
jgi:hypothetical protein